MTSKSKTQNHAGDVETIRHSFAHVLAYAVQELYPQVKLGMGPAIENGFYYDFDFSQGNAAPTSKDLPAIEKRMRAIIKRGPDFKKESLPITEVKELFRDQPYKFELAGDLAAAGEKKATIYRTSKFIDLCAGPHVASAKLLSPDAFRLQRIAGAYWKGSEKNPMLTRIYGVAFGDAGALAEYIERLEEAEKRDHRKLGQQLDLFVFSDLVGKGLPMFTPKGSMIRRVLENFIIEEESKRGYRHVYTPELAKVDLYRASGHYPYYKDTMYPVMKVDEEELILRPMSCPHHFQLYAARPHSYKELPYRIAELARLYRYEKSGELTGLVRAREFCLADAHIICQKEAAVKEIGRVLDLIEYCTRALGLKKGRDFHYRLSLGERSDEKKYFKDDASWDAAEVLLKSVLKKRRAVFVEAPNEAAFYGPKIDIQMKNIAGKEETAFTVQYDFVMPKRFALTYIDRDGTKKEPIVIHRSSIGCIERIMAFLLEHYAGALPLWMSPVQAEVIPIGKTHKKYARVVLQTLDGAGIRAGVNDADESVSKRIRDGELQKIPYLLVVGDKEVKSEKVSVRKRGKGDLGAMAMARFLTLVQKDVKEKK